MRLYAVIDRKAKSIVNVFVSNSDESAERSFLMLLTDNSHNIFTDFPEDFDLYCVGTLSFTSFLKVARSGMENLDAAGFTADSYTVLEPLKCGCEYDKRYLRMVVADRWNLHADLGECEVSEDGM